MQRKTILIFLLFLLIASISFGIGFLVSGEFARPPIIIQKGS